MPVPTARSRAERRVNVVELRMESSTSSTVDFWRVYTCENSEAAITQWGKVGTIGEYNVVAVSSLPDRITNQALSGYERHASTHVLVDADTWQHATGTGKSQLGKQAFEMISAAAVKLMADPETVDERKTRLMKAAQEFIAALEPIARGEWP